MVANSAEIDKTLAFFAEIGLTAKQGEVTAGFLPDVEIREGEIIYNTYTLVSDLLHEAGHVAIIPKCYRSMVSGEIEASVQKIWDVATQSGVIVSGSPIFSALLQSSDTEATAWAFAAGKHIGIAEERIILDRQYQRSGREIRSALSINCYPGINGLRAAGLIQSVKQYPQLTNWTQP